MMGTQICLESHVPSNTIDDCLTYGSMETSTWSSNSSPDDTILSLSQNNLSTLNDVCDPVPFSSIEEDKRDISKLLDTPDLEPMLDNLTRQLPFASYSMTVSISNMHCPESKPKVYDIPPFLLAWAATPREVFEQYLSYDHINCRGNFENTNGFSTSIGSVDSVVSLNDIGLYSKPTEFGCTNTKTGNVNNSKTHEQSTSNKVHKSDVKFESGRTRKYTEAFSESNMYKNCVFNDTRGWCGGRQVRRKANPNNSQPDLSPTGAMKKDATDASICGDALQPTMTPVDRRSQPMATNFNKCQATKRSPSMHSAFDDAGYRVPGVWFDSNRRLWRVMYNDGDKRKTKGFSVKEFSYDEARRRAVALKYDMMHRNTANSVVVHK